jgi:hypothetical protein
MASPSNNNNNLVGLNGPAGTTNNIVTTTTTTTTTTTSNSITPAAAATTTDSEKQQQPQRPQPKKQSHLIPHDLTTLDPTKLTPLSPEVISRQATINIVCVFKYSIQRKQVTNN